MTNSAMEPSDHGAPFWTYPGDAEKDAVSAYEISELVCGALQDAILAASQPCPDTYLDILEIRKRNHIAARLDDLPAVQLSHPVVQAEVLKELAMLRVQSDLASGIVESIQDYARSKRSAVLAAMN